MQNTTHFKYIHSVLISKKPNISQIFRLVLLLCFIFCVHPAIAGTFTEDSLQIAAYYEKVQSGDSAGARDWLFVLSNNPDDELARKANFLLAKTTFDAGDFDGALEAIALGVPELLNDWGTYLKALAYLEVGRPTDAAE
ncbi:tetratricopeptide repeat protein, partial [bacterium]|nr:tetratricopeptide repeat protein [bacterium]